MYLHAESRYLQAQAIRSADGHVYFALRFKAEYYGGRDEAMHRIIGGDTLQNIAARYYKGAFNNAAAKWWAICDLQPEPILDPTIALTAGKFLIVPSVGDVQSVIQGELEGEEAVL
jgi:hypothetical protein